MGVTAVPRVAVLKGMAPKKDEIVVSSAERASVLSGVTITASCLLDVCSADVVQLLFRNKA